MCTHSPIDLSQSGRDFSRLPFQILSSHPFYFTRMNNTSGFFRLDFVCVFFLTHPYIRKKSYIDRAVSRKIVCSSRKLSNLFVKALNLTCFKFPEASKIILEIIKNCQDALETFWKRREPLNTKCPKRLIIFFKLPLELFWKRQSHLVTIKNRTKTARML